MKKARGWGLLRMMLAFFAGVLVTLYFLVPGKNGPTILVSGDASGQISDLDQAGQKVEKMSDVALFYAYKAKGFVHKRLAQADQ